MSAKWKLSTLACVTCALLVLSYAAGGVRAQSDVDASDDPSAKPVFRIVAPQVICKRNRNAPEVELPKQITISMQTKGGQTLTYRVQMFFEVLGGFRGQQHSLILWNSVRKLEHKINTLHRPIISRKNQINVNNTELTPGVYYIFKIVGIDAAGVESDPQNYTVTFADGSIKRTNNDGSIIPDDISFLLLGAESTYADVDYTVEADVFFCEPRNDYLIQWTVNQLPADRSEFLRIPGSLLRIPAGTLRGGANHTIRASLLRANDSVVLIYQTVTVTVLTRGYSITFAPELTTTGIGQPVQVALVVRDPDNTGVVPEVNWSCSPPSPNAANDTTGECDGFVSSAGFVQSLEFYAQGEFKITADVKMGENASAFHSVVMVHKDIIARPLLQNVPVQAIQAGTRFEFEGIIDDLVPDCYCFWELMNETDFAFFDQAGIPGGLGNKTFYDLDGTFLSELVDYGNATFSEELMLVVPAKNGIEAPTFEGLLGDVQYKFRLNAVCPAPITDVDDMQVVRPNVTSYADMVLTTNSPPMGRELEITPRLGNALKSVFKFSTGVARDQALDYPLKYNFLIRIGQFVISVGEFYENMVTTTVLPYSEEPIATMYEVCDSRRACATINGLNITVKKWPMSDRELDIIVARINGSMERLEYDKAFRLALLTAISLKNTNDPAHLATLQAMVETSIGQQTQRLKEIFSQPSPNVYVTSTEVVNFINHARQTLSVFEQKNDALIQQLVKLIDVLNNGGVGDARRRRKRSVITSLDGASKKSDEIHAKLDLTGTLLNSDNAEVVQQAKSDVIQTVHSAMTKLCRKESFGRKSYDKSFMKFELREITAKQLLRVNHSVPFTKDPMPAVVSFNGNMLLFTNRPTAKCCIGKAMYSSDFIGLDDETPPREIYEVAVLAVGDTGSQASMLPLNDGTGGRGFDVLIPFYDPKEAAVLKCQVWDHKWNENVCDTIGASGNYIKCKCRQLGFFRLFASKNNTEPTTVTVAPPVDEPATKQTESPEDTSTTVSKQSDPTTIHTSTTTTPTPTTTTPTSTITTPTTTTSTPSTTSTKNPLTNSTTERHESLYRSTDPESTSSTGYIVAGSLVGFGAIAVTGLYVFNRRKRPITLSNLTNEINTELREPVPGIKYARFHDEHTMRGNSIETLFNGHG